MANIIFTKGADTFTFECGRKYPIHDPVQVNVPVDYSEGGQLYAYDKGIVEQFFTLDLEKISQNDFDNFADWLENIAVGPKNTFTFTDENSANHTVRLLDTKNPLKEVAMGLFGGVVTLRKEI